MSINTPFVSGYRTLLDLSIRRAVACGLVQSEIIFRRSKPIGCRVNNNPVSELLNRELVKYVQPTAIKATCASVYVTARIAGHITENLSVHIMASKHVSSNWEKMLNTENVKKLFERRVPLLVFVHLRRWKEKREKKRRPYPSLPVSGSLVSPNVISKMLRV